MLLELTKEEVEALNHMLKVEINSYKTDELESEEFNTLIQFAKKVRNIEPSEALQWARISKTSTSSITYSRCIVLVNRSIRRWVFYRYVLSKRFVRTSQTICEVRRAKRGASPPLSTRGNYLPK